MYSLSLCFLVQEIFCMCCTATKKYHVGLGGGLGERSQYQQLKREGDHESEGAIGLGVSSGRGCDSQASYYSPVLHLCMLNC